jgi:hypothetical protein
MTGAAPFLACPVRLGPLAEFAMRFGPPMMVSAVLVAPLAFAWLCRRRFATAWPRGAVTNSAALGGAVLGTVAQFAALMVFGFAQIVGWDDLLPRWTGSEWTGDLLFAAVVTSAAWFGPAARLAGLTTPDAAAFAVGMTVLQAFGLVLVWFGGWVPAVGLLSVGIFVVTTHTEWSDPPRDSRFGPDRCRRCAYDLRGSPSGICPECGLNGWAVPEPEPVYRQY